MKSLSRLVALLLLSTFILPAPLLTLPQHAHAGVPTTIDADFSLTGITTMIKTTISAAADVTTSINATLMKVKEYVLDPLAFVLSGNLLRSLTAGIVDFINGGNSSGNPLYVRNLSQHLLGVRDQQALTFFAELGHSNSPFGSTVLNSLRMNYLQGSSGAGFWSANQCTLNQYSANPSAFIAGNFNQGGFPAWFALTSQPQNNPYLFYYRAQAELSARTEQGVADALTELSWGDGFLSWCGEQDSTEEVVGADGLQDSVAITSNNNCTTKDKKPGTIKTPASVIRDSLQKALGTDVDRLIRTGDASTIFSNIQNSLQILAYGASLLGAGNSGGLFGASHPSGVTPTSMVAQFRNQPTVSQAAINQNAATAQQTYGQSSLQNGQSQAATFEGTLPNGTLPGGTSQGSTGGGQFGGL